MNPSVLSRAESEIILHEIREGTPDTPERVVLIRGADELYQKLDPYAALVDAALDQKSPSPALVVALNDVLILMQHDARLHDEQVAA